MNLKTVTIANLTPHPNNPNTHPASQISALGDSLDQFDQVKNIVIWKGRILAGHGVVEAAIKTGRLTLEAIDISHWPEDKATAFMLADIRLPEMAYIDEVLMDEALKSFIDIVIEDEALRTFDAPVEIPGFDEDYLKDLPGFESDTPPPPPETPPQVDKAEELQKEWGVSLGDIWQIESNANPGHYHRLICGDCRDLETVKRLTEDKPINGVFTSPPYAMQRAKQYGGVPTDEYVEWWEAVQENIRAVLAEDGSFFVNIKPHCEDKQRSLYVMDLVCSMVRRWEWRFVDELCWKHQGMPGIFGDRLKNQFEPVYHFSISKCRTNFDNVKYYSSKVPSASIGSNANMQGVGDPLRDRIEGEALPGNLLEIGIGNPAEFTGQAAQFPLPLPTFFIKAYSDSLDTWLDPFAGSGTTMIAAENEGRIGLGIEILPKYCAVILERFLTHSDTSPPELIT